MVLEYEVRVKRLLWVPEVVGEEWYVMRDLNNLMNQGKEGW